MTGFLIFTAIFAVVVYLIHRSSKNRATGQSGNTGGNTRRTHRH